MSNPLTSLLLPPRRPTPRRPLQGIAAIAVAAFVLAVSTSGQVSNPPTGFGCGIQDNNTGTNLVANSHGDPLFRIVTSRDFCPNNALEFRNLLKTLGLQLRPAMVADRGYNNPLPQGLFSFFESVTGEYGGLKLEPGDWFFGHFQAAVNNDADGTSELQEQNEGTPDNLLLESVVWDPSIGMYRFYEIRGNGQGGTWFYRGSSLDILKDIRNVWRNTDPAAPIFGDAPAPDRNIAGGPRLRCSGCHMNGGPIMKELEFPHDMWWLKKRPLPLGSLVLQPAVQIILGDVVDADEFATWVKAGYRKLFDSDPYMGQRSQLSLQEQLRVLFCEQEVNLAADLEPLGNPKATVVQAPIGFFVDPRLVPDGPKSIEIRKDLYLKALAHFQTQFIDNQANGQTAGVDADHGFSSPVKAYSDNLLAEAMVKRKLIDEDFVIAVISVDMTRPMFSRARASLLSLLPDAAGPNWRNEFVEKLKASASPAAKELYLNLTDPARNKAFQLGRARALAQKLQANAGDKKAVTGWVRLLAQRRVEVFQSEISQHPHGQIFEPEFRLLFPTLQLIMPDRKDFAYGGVAGQYWLNPETGLVELAR